MNKRQYIDHVLRLLNEASVSEREGFDYAGGDNSDVVKQITAAFIYAWRKNLSIIPRHWFTVKNFATPPEDLRDGSGRIPLPADFFQLYAFRMKTWKKDAYTAHDEASDIDLMQTNPYARGTPQRPVCIIRKQSDDNQTDNFLHYYSLPRHVHHEIERALYIPQPPDLTSLRENDPIAVDEKAAPSLCYFAAAAVSRIFLNEKAAEILEKEAIQTIYAPIHNTTQK